MLSWKLGVLGAPHKRWPATPFQVRPFPLSSLPSWHDPASHFTQSGGTSGGNFLASHQT